MCENGGWLVAARAPPVAADKTRFIRTLSLAIAREENFVGGGARLSCIGFARDARLAADAAITLVNQRDRSRSLSPFIL